MLVLPEAVVPRPVPRPGTLAVVLTLALLPASRGSFVLLPRWDGVAPEPREEREDGIRIPSQRTNSSGEHISAHVPVWAKIARKDGENLRATPHTGALARYSK